MTKANEPDDPKAESGQSGNVVPPWQRAETSAQTGLTAGDVAKAAKKITEDGSAAAAAAAHPTTVRRGPGEPAETPPPAPSGPRSGPPSTGPNPAPPSPAPANPAPSKAAPPKSAPAAKTPPPAKTPPVKAPAPSQARKSSPPSGPIPQQAPPASKPLITGTAAPKPIVTGTAAPTPPAPPKPSGEERLNLDAIHKVGGADDSADRAAVKHIPAATIGTPLRAAVQVRRVDPWSVFKITGVLSVVGFLIWMIAVAVLYGILGGMGVWDQINNSFGNFVSGDGASSTGDLISGGQVFGFSALFGVFAAIVVTAIATISAYIYNVMADTVGGIEVTLADLD